MQLRCAGNGDNPRFLREQPRERNLCRRRVLSFCELLEKINECLVCFSILFGKARNDVAEIFRVELRVFRDLAGEKSLTQRTEGYKAYAQFLAGRQYFLFR